VIASRSTASWWWS